MSLQVTSIVAQDDHEAEAHESVNHHDADHDHSAHDSHAVDQDSHGAHDGPSCEPHGEEAFDAKEMAIHHISDANVYTILDAVRIPLPCIVYAKEAGWDFFMSSKFAPGHHDDGHYAHNGYVLHMGALKRVVGDGFPMEGKQEVGAFSIAHVDIDGKEVDQSYVCYNNKPFLLESKSTLDGGLLEEA